MSWRDREYARSPQGRGQVWPPTRRVPLIGGSVVTTLIVINVAVFVLCQVTINRNAAQHPALRGEEIITSPVFQFSAMVTGPVEKRRIWPLFREVDRTSTQLCGVAAGEVWRIITAQYLHWSFGHILMNMLGLHFLGRALERDWGSKRFFFIYLIAGTLGMLFYMALTLLGWLPMFGVAAGASGCVLGLLGACAVRYPHAEVLIYFLFPIKIRTAALIFGAWYIWNVVDRGQNAGGDACHIAGLLFGAWWAYRGERWWERVGRRTAPWRVRSTQSKAPDFTVKIVQRRDDAETVDRILKKVYEGGIHSLTEEEKRALTEATQRQRQAESGSVDRL